ncbi:MAG: radical SAM protein, partial [Chitinophagales bacterium]
QSVNDIIPVFEKERPSYFVIYDDGFNYLTKMCLTNMREAAFEMIAIAKQYGCTIIISSSDATDHAEEYLRKGADYIIKGEAEITLLELMEALSTGSSSNQNIAGLSFLSGSEIINTSKRNVLQHLDSIPFPAWDLVDMNLYQKKWRGKNGYFSLNLTTTRGCPFKCNWCAKPIYGNRYNSRSPQNVVNEIKMLLQKYKPDHFWFCDDIFGLKPGWIKSFSELVQQEQLHFKFKIQCRVDLLLEENNIEWLAKAGCETIWVGAESGSQKILDAMDKGTQVEQIYTATRLLKKHNIKPAFFLQFGYLGETKEDIAATKKMLLELMPHDLGISVSYPLPGTKFYEKVKEQLHVKANWTDSDDLAMMYKGTYSPAFYRQLHTYIHKLFRRQQGIESIGNLFRIPLQINKQQLRSIVLLPYFITLSWWNYYKLNFIVRN